MTSRTSREFSSRLNALFARTPAWIASRAGRGRSFQHVEHLESRQMLAGDHPSLPAGPTPWAATAISLDLVSPTGSPDFGRGNRTGVIAVGDPGDLFTFTMPTVMQGGKAKDFVTVLADTANVVGGSTLDSMVEVYNQSGQLITLGQSNGGVSIGVTTNPTLPKAPDGWAGFEATAGQTYYVRVRADTSIGSGRTNSGGYILRVDTVTVPIVIDTISANTSVFGTGRETANVSFAQDDVVYAITTPNDDRFNGLSSLQATSLDVTTPQVNPHLDLYSAGNTQGVVTQLVGDQDSGRQTDAFTVYRTAKNTTYYLRVRADDYRPTSTPGSGTVGAFTAFVRMAAPEIVVDPVTRLGATDPELIVGPDLSTGAPLDGAGMRLFKFTAQGTGQGIITAIGGGLIPNTDGVINPAIRLYDANGLSIDFNKALASTAQIQTPLIGGQTYYIVAEGFDSTADLTNNTRDGSVRIFVEAHHTFNPTTGQEVDDHVNTPATGGLGSLPQWSNATPIRFNDPEQFTDTWTQAGQTPPVTTVRQDNSWTQTGVATGRLNQPGDTDLFQFTPPVSQLSDYGGDFARNTPSLFVGGNYATAGLDAVDGTAAKRNNISVWDLGNWFDTGPRDMRDAGNNLLDGPIDGPIHAQQLWDPDAGGPIQPVLAVAGEFTHVWSLVPNAAGILENRVVPANVAFRVFYPPENRFIWSTSIGYRVVPGTNRYTTITNPITITGTILASAAFDAEPNIPGQTGASADELFLGGDFQGNFNPADPMEAFNSLAQLKFVPNPAFPDRGTLEITGMGGGVTRGAGVQGIVRAFTVYDSGTPTLPTNPAPMPTPMPAQPDAPNSLYIGGLFTTADQPDGITPATVTATNIVRYGKRIAGDNNPNLYMPLFHNFALINGPAGNNPATTTPAPLQPMQVVPATATEGLTPTGAGTNGGVYTLAVMDAPGQENSPAAPWGPTPGMPQDIPQRLYIGGAFTRNVLSPTAANGESVSNLVSYDGNNYNAVGNTPDIGTGTGMFTGIVRTLAVWFRTQNLQTTGPDPVLVVGADATPLGAGAQFANSGIIRQWGGRSGQPMAWSTLGTTPDGTVLSMTVATENEPATAAPYQQLYIGGTFTQITANGVTTPNINRIARFATFNPQANQWVLQWSALTGGLTGLSDPPPNNQTTTAVYSLTTFQDQPAGEVRRNSRPGSRIQIRVNREDESQETENLLVRVFDSNFTLLYTNDSVAAGAADPAGGNNPAFGFTNFIMPETWAGESYYIEVSGGGTGRYRLSLTTDALPPKDPNATPDGVYTDTISTITKPVGAGQFVNAPLIPVDQFGYGKNYAIDPNGPLATGRVPKPGDPQAPFDPNFPNAYSKRTFIPDVNGFVRYDNEDTATISVPNETHIYQFRAPNDGTVELRLATKQIQAAWSEQLIDELTPGRPFATGAGGGGMNPNLKNKIINSPLHGALRVFTNDRSTGQFVQTGFANDNPAVTGFGQVIPYRGGGNFTPADANQRVFTHDDVRLVIPVQRGNTYFVQVESAFKALFASNPDLVDWRFATGRYELTVRATNSLNGIDDYENAQPDFFGNLPTLLDDTSIILDAKTGRGSINGEIRNVTTGPFQNAIDSDTFRWYATNAGQVRVTLTPTSPLLTPRLEVVAGDGSRPATGAATGPNQPVTVTFSATQGQALFFIVSGVNSTQGTYTLSVQAPGLTDDQPFSDATDVNNQNPVTGWANARDLTLNRFLGAYGVPNPTTGAIQDATGTIENPADQDIFKFTAESYELATVTVTRTDNSLDPFVQVYEIGKDGADHDVFLRIAQNDEGAGVAPNARTIFSTTPGRTYYVVVGGASLVTDFGRYSLRINVTPTDDHPNRSDFPAGTLINLAFDSINFTSTGSATGRIERTTDEDLFRFVAPADGTATVSVSRRNSSTLKIGVTLLDANNQGFPGGRVSYTFGPNGTVNVRLTGLTSNTQYFILIQPDVPGAGETQTGDYTVTVNTDPVDDYPNAGQFSIAQNIPLSSGTNSGTINGVLVPTGDSDIFKFTTLVTGTATVRVSTPNSGLNPRVVIFNAGQTQTQAIDGNGDSATIGFSVTAGELYYVLVLANTAATGAAAVGSYTVTVTNVQSGGGGGGGGGPDDYPNAGEWNDAFNIGLDSRTGRGSLDGVINFSGDTDLFKFTPAASGATDIQLNIPRGGSVDGQLEVYDSGRNLLFTDALGIAGATAAISFNATGGQQYFVLVRPSGPATGSYTLRLATIPLTSVLFYPEGFAGGSVNEFIPIVNPNSFPVTYQLFARYETGANPNTPIASGTIAANSRDGVATITSGNLGGALVRTGVGYALELRTSAPVGATLSHFDFSATIGESFTDLTSTTWTFAEAHKDRTNWRDFLLFYNPGNTTANLTIQAFYTDGFTTSFNATLDSLRRGGINIDDEGRLTRQGTFGIKVTSDVPIVSSLTSYNLPRAGGDGLLGDASGGATRGVMPGIQSGAGVVSNFSFLNANNAPATVTLVASYARLDLPAVTRTITIPARSSYTATFDSIGLIAGQNAGVSYSSDVAITMSTFEFQNGDGDTTTTATTAAKTQLFSDIVIDPTLAGVQYKQRLSFFNPTAQSIDVAATLLFSDGTTASISTRVEANNYAFLQLDQQPAVLARTGLATFGLKLDSSQPFVASLLSYNLLLGGGWSQQGQPIGLTTLLSNLT